MIPRSQPRAGTQFRVLSRHLPGHGATSLDFSQTGVQLETEHQLEVGAELVLDLEFDRSDLRDFSCLAKVVWSKPDRARGRFRTGLAFLPSNTAQRIALARTSTVLQARSESDLETLLGEARALDAERAETFARVHAQPRHPSARRVLPHLGVVIPLRILLDGYQWDRKSGLLVVGFLDSHQAEHRLYFPHCQILTDYGCAAGPTVAALFCTPHSDMIKKMPRRGAGEGWKHYRFLQADRQPVLELVSGPCLSRLS